MISPQVMPRALGSAIKEWTVPESVKVAAVQAAPVFLDRDATTAKACGLIKEAGAGGASLVVFPETFVPTYPDWVWRVPAWNDGAFVDRLRVESVAVPSPVTQQLGEAAAEAGTYVAIGVNEIDGATLYNTLLYFSPAGDVVGRHRKLMPTGGERTVWGMGDGSTFDVVETPFGIVGGLICWENYMPLARAAMYAKGVDIYVAPTWDNSDSWVATLRHIAKEGRCYVIGVSPLLRGSDVPAELRGETYGGDDDWMSRGFATIVGPDGDVIAGPLSETEEILYADIEPATIAAHRHYFDPVGHYSRPDVFHLSVDTARRSSVTFTS
jgi:nitrilase